MIKHFILISLFVASLQIKNCKVQQPICKICAPGFQLIKSHLKNETKCMNESDYEALQDIEHCIEEDSKNTTLCQDCERDYIISRAHDHCFNYSHCSSLLNDEDTCSNCYPPFVLNETTCIKKVLCKKMKDGKCTDCKEYYYPNEEGDCERIPINHCKIGNSTGCETCDNFYYKDDNNNCTHFPPHCSSVINKKCQSCDGDYYYPEGLECKPYPDYCYEIDQETKNCTSCHQYYYPEEKKCKPYPLNCKEINEDKECKTCLDYFYLKEKKCEPYPLNCKVIKNGTNECIECQPLYYLFNGNCKANSDNCKDMNNNTEICRECKEYYYLDGKVCQPYPEHCKTFDNISMECEVCNDGYYPDGKECKLLPDHCKSVDNSKKQCENCFTSYFLNKWVECESLPENCQSFDFNRYRCKKCVKYYYLDDENTCLPNPKFCSLVNETTKKCIQCYDTYELDDKNNCIPNQEHCKIMNETTKNCSQCIYSYYLDKNNKCQQLPEHCRYVNLEWENCTSCDPFYYPEGLKCKPYPSNCNIIDEETKKCQVCNETYYLFNGECKPYPDHCHILDNDTEHCLECYSYYHLDDTFKCVDNSEHCQVVDMKTMNCFKCDNYYYEEGLGCKSFPPNCNKIYDDTKKCKKCNSSFYLYNEECKPIPDNCELFFNETEQCFRCNKRFYLYNNKCIENPEHCQEVDDIELNCTKCDNYYYEEGLGCKSYPPNCNKIYDDTKKCRKCNTSFYLDNEECKPYPDNCISVYNETDQCIKCRDGYYLNNDYKCIENPEHCIKVDNKTKNCSDCEYYYYLDDEKKCKPYPEHCINVNESNICIECESLFFLDDEKKCIPYPAHCISVNDSNICTNCEDYYHLEGSICKENPSHCIQIDGLPQRCGSCDSGYYPKSRVKCDQLPDHCEKIDSKNKCEKCEKYYYLKEEVCQPYPEHCIEMDKDHKNCTKCDYQYYYILDGQCKPYPDHCIKFDVEHKECQACSDNQKFYLDEKICKDYPPYCSSFSVPQKSCITCFDTHYLDDGKCKLKPHHCKEVNTLTKTCHNCIDSYNLIDGECKDPCIEKEEICNECDNNYDSYDYGKSCEILDNNMKPTEYELKISYQKNRKFKLGHHGIMYFITDYYDNVNGLFDINDMTQQTTFSTKVIDEKNKNYDVDCSLFKTIDERVIIICNMKEDLELGEHNLTLANHTLTINNTKFHIISENSIKVIQYNYSIPFIYSAPVTINLGDGQEKYTLKFKSYDYDGDIMIYISGNYTHTVVDKSNIVNNELICEVSRQKLESILVNNEEGRLFMLGTMNDNYGSFTFDLGYIYIQYDINQKVDVEVNITRLLTKNVLLGTTVVYETQAEPDISYVRTEIFKLEFSNNNEFSCYLKKNDKTPSLLLICSPTNDGEFYLGELKKYNYLVDKHYKYNFNIHPVENYERITIQKSSKNDTIKDFDLVNPGELDLTSGKSLVIRYLADSTSLVNKIKLNPDSDTYLECEHLTNMIKCTVPLSHFQGKSKGVNEFRTLQCIDSPKICSELYDIDPIKITLPEIITMKIEKNINEVNSVKIGQKGVIYLTTNYNDGNNKFNPTNLEQFTFKGIFIDEEEKNNTYTSVCKLWKLSDNKINILCKLDEDLKKQNQIIHLQQTSFIYTGANNEDLGVIISYEAESINVRQLKSEISFLYAEKQEIEIVEDKNTYDLVFKQYFRDNNPLYLYSYNIRSIILDSCSSSNNQLTCKVSKDNLLEILSYSGEVFSVGEKYDNNGIYKFDSVFDITIKSKIAKKEIKLKIEKLLTNRVSENEFIAYETNIENTKAFTSDYFYITSAQSNGRMHCLFKKSINQNKLLLLCDAKNSGSLGRVKTIKYDNINALYNLIIEESENYDHYQVSSSQGTKVFSVNPLELNFNNKDEYIIQYEAEYPNNYKRIKLNEDSVSELECETKDGYRQCKVNANHFSSNGKYYTHHSYGIGEDAISYELPMINVILKENSPNGGDEAKDKDESSNTGLIIGLSVAGGVIVLAVVIFLIWHYCRKKDSDEYDSNDGKGKLLTTS